jgi:regulator of protease activity HflC (stomatin/prohibitin superfamily)
MYDLNNVPQNSNEQIRPTAPKSFATLVFVAILVIGGLLVLCAYRGPASLPTVGVLEACVFIVACLVSSAIQIADQWEKAVVLRLGKFQGLRGPGLFVIIPFIDAIVYWIDTRVLTTAFKAEKTLTKDTVPVDVVAVLFWKVLDPEKAALNVADYQSAINWAAQTALRDVIGKTMLSDMLEGRDKISALLQKIIDERTEPWGINVISVEVKDVLIPAALENAMSMQAQADRERQARVILGDSERLVAESFGEAAKTYLNNPVALHLRAMNMLYEGLKANSTIVIVPSSAVESMDLGGLSGMTALTMGIDQKSKFEASKIEPTIEEQHTGNGARTVPAS